MASPHSEALCVKMKTQAFVISISLFFCAEACAVRVVTCDKPDSDYIAAKFSSGAFVQANEIRQRGQILSSYIKVYQ